ncbi:TPA: hypothetical protein ACMEW0_002448 [Klebsiella quasipneumoniae subsp. quasipneumoniae]
MQRSNLSPNGGEATALALTLEKSREASGCPAGVDLQDWVKQLAEQRDAALNAERAWESVVMEVCGEDGQESVAAVINALTALAAENAALKEDRDTLARYWIEDGGDKDCAMSYCEPTPATDRIVAGIKADGRAEGINFAASRLAAAFNHGHVDKPMAEVGDVVRMILTAKEDLANDQALPEDGLSGEYAEKSLAEWEAELREGADK